MTVRHAYWLVFVLMLAVYGAMVFWTLPAISDGAGGLLAFDLRPAGYSTTEARAFLDVLSDEARAVYLGPQRWLDMVYPALFGVVLAGAISALIRQIVLVRVLLLVVVASVLADYCENYLVAQLLMEDKTVSERVISLTSQVTIAKSVFGGVAMTAVLGALVMAGVAKWRSR